MVAINSHIQNILQSLELNEISHITFIKNLRCQNKQNSGHFSPHVVLLEKVKSDNQVAFSS